MNKALYFLAVMSCAFAQERVQFNWDSLAAKASEKVDVSLEGPTLEMASKFLTSAANDAKSDNFKKVIQGLKGVYVKSFEFDKEGQYSQADLNAIRSQLRAPEWSKIVDVQEKHESSVIYLKTDGKVTQGIVVLAAEPKELTFVEIIGPIDPSMLSALGGKMGIPRMEMGPKAKPKPPTEPKP